MGAQRRRIQDLQERLYAENGQDLLVVLQAMDTGGKGGTIKHVFGGVNPQGAPSAEEANHDFLWRYQKSAPAKGRIGIFKRSHYEDVLVVRVRDIVPEEVWRQRYGLISEFNRNLTRIGIAVLKFFPHISKDEQKRRPESRLADPDKRWSYFKNDINERAVWDDYQAALEDAINECSTSRASWYVVPANKQWYRARRRRPHHRRHPRSHGFAVSPGRTGFGERHDTGLAPGFMVRKAAAASGLGYDVPGSS